jgi:hypothetical protein
MITSFASDAETAPRDAGPAPVFHWPIEDEVGRWEALDPWARPLGGVRIDGEHLCFEYRKPLTKGRGPVELATADFGMLTPFAELARGDSIADGRLLAFASRYGALGLCREHGGPLAHRRPHCASESEVTYNGEHYRERIGRWFYFSRLARAVLVAFTSKAKEEREAALAELRTFIANNKVPGAATAWEPYRIILQWLAGGELRLWFRDRPPRLTLYGVPPLWTALGLELATHAVRAKGIILCSACGKLDTVKRPRPTVNPNRRTYRTYCSDCRKLPRKRDAVADYRARVRRATGLRAQHLSVAAIADELGVSQQQVKRYLALAREK